MAASASIPPAAALKLSQSLPSTESLVGGPFAVRTFVTTGQDDQDWSFAGVGIATLVVDRTRKACMIRVYPDAAGTAGRPPIVVAELYTPMR